MRIFLTGATGYIGAAVLDALVGAGTTSPRSCATTKRPRALAARGARPVVGNLADPESFRGAADAQDGYIHTAFDSTPRGPSIERAALDIIVAAAKRPRTAGSTAPAKRFVIYTSGSGCSAATSEPAAEERPINPVPLVSWRPEHEQFVLDAAD